MGKRKWCWGRGMEIPNRPVQEQPGLHWDARPWRREEESSQPAWEPASRSSCGKALLHARTCRVRGSMCQCSLRLRMLPPLQARSSTEAGGLAEGTLRFLQLMLPVQT